jgi:hypothetical protein
VRDLERSPLWIVRTTVDPLSGAGKLQPWQMPSIGDCKVIVTRRRGEVFESLVSGNQGRANALRKRPDVIDVNRAQDGVFSDKSFGTVTISEGGTRYLIEGPNPGSVPEIEGWRQGMTMPRWKRRIWKARHDQEDADQ